MERTGIPAGSAMPRGTGRGQDGPQRMLSRMPFSTKWAQPTDAACGCTPAFPVSPPACVRPAILALHREVFGQFPRGNGGALDLHQFHRGTRRHRSAMRRQNHTPMQAFSASLGTPGAVTGKPSGGPEGPCLPGPATRAEAATQGRYSLARGCTARPCHPRGIADSNRCV